MTRSSAPARPRRRWPRRLVAGLVLAAVAFAGMAAVLDRIGMAPRALAPYIEKRTSGHNPVIVSAGGFVSRALLDLDRGSPAPFADPGLTLGAQVHPAGNADPAGKLVASPDELRAALAGAEPGDRITLLPGTYRFAGAALDANRPGRSDAPITVRAAQPGSVHIQFQQVEGFRVSAPYWRFENLEIRGTCQSHGDCEHAFHVVGAARHFVAVNNVIADFNAHFKINGVDADFPDGGLIESNTLFNTQVRHTVNPVTPIDLVAANGWVVRANVIKDFVKDDGNRVSYGAFFKGGGAGNVFERNLVRCEDRLHGEGGQSVGLSLGGGGTDRPYCRDRRCITEQDHGSIRANLILACSDAGIYVNNAADSRIENNTLIDTTGIDVRFAASSATLNGNLVDGPIRARDGALLHLDDNRTGAVWQSFIGVHPVRALFADPLGGDLRWRTSVPPTRGVPSKSADLCTSQSRRRTAYGAFDSFAGCLTP